MHHILIDITLGTLYETSSELSNLAFKLANSGRLIILRENNGRWEEYIGGKFEKVLELEKCLKKNIFHGYIINNETAKTTK